MEPKIVRRQTAMLSRTAEAIYWMSRYVERAENLARFVDVTFNLILDSVKLRLTFLPGYGTLWFAALSTLGIFFVAVGLGLLVRRVKFLRWLSP